VNRQAPLIFGLIAFLIFLLAHLFLMLRVQLVLVWFYPIVWWSYIFIVDSIIDRRTGRSLIWEGGRRFWLMAAWSAVIWLLFEAFNLRLENWWYHGVPVSRPIRWAGTLISFATVIPLLAETERLLNSFRVFDRTVAATIRVTPGLLLASQITGTLMLLACLLFPRYTFPLVWGGVVLLIDPINYRAGAPSLLRDWVNGRPGRTYRLLTAGLIAGLLWEFWNFWAVARWSYTVPFVGNWKIFEMPVLGFLGFPPFALEAFALYQFFCRPWGASIWPRPSASAPMRRPSKVVTLLAIILVLLFCLIVLLAIDRHTILSFADGSIPQ
jgi:hypothetical protein